MSEDPPPVALPVAAEVDLQPLPESSEPPDVTHVTREVKFFHRRTPIVYQEKPGPCPLFAICNCLLLKGVISLENEGLVSEKKLLSLVAHQLQVINEGCNREKDIKDAIDLLPGLPSGLNINLFFSRVDGFELTRERRIFDLLNIPLYHGLIVDPQDIKIADAIGSKSHFELLCGRAEFESVKATKGRGDMQEEYEVAMALQLSKAESEAAGDGAVTCDISKSESSSSKMTGLNKEANLSEQVDKTAESSSVDEQSAKWDLVDNFLDINKTQITAYGIYCLHKDVKDDELCVLFRNDHFNTMFKHNGRLYLLANADAYVDLKDVTWESLELSGSGQPFTSDFMPVAKPPRNDSCQEQAAMSIDSFAQADNTSGGIPSADRTDDKMTDMLNEQCLSRAHSSKLLAFDAIVANGFIVKKEWEALDDYLGNFLATVLKKTPDEVVMMHPGLFMIPRIERLLDMLRDQNFEEANSFYQSSIALLRGCQGRYVPLDLVYNIDVLYTGVQRRYWSEKRETNENILNIVSGYTHVYFCREDEKADGLWQFAKKFPKPTKMVGDKKKNYHPFMCLLCGWSKNEQVALSHLRSHFLLKTGQIKMCPKVTEEVLDRIRAVNPEGVPTFEGLKAKFNGRKNKRPIVSWVTTSGTSKKPRPDCSQSLGSFPSLSHQLLVSYESTQSDKETNNRIMESELPVSVDTSLTNQMKHVQQTTGRTLSLPGQPVLELPGPLTNRVTNPIYDLYNKLLEEIAAIRSCVPTDVRSIYAAFVALQFAILELRSLARPNDIHPEPEKLSSLVASVVAKAHQFNECIITPSIVPNMQEQDRLFLMEKLAVVNELILFFPL